uniref:Uncharacterized protein n=1 Tax=Anguilla anguilla TaxID=7936 RepID=A0A0E9WQ84_ANGAN
MISPRVPYISNQDFKLSVGCVRRFETRRVVNTLKLDVCGNRPQSYQKRVRCLFFVPFTNNRPSSDWPFC